MAAPSIVPNASALPGGNSNNTQGQTTNTQTPPVASNKGIPGVYINPQPMGNGMDDAPEWYGVPSLFNPQLALFRYEGMYDNNELLFDVKDQASIISEQSKISSIVKKPV